MKKNIIFGLIIVSFVLAGCKQEAKDAKEASTEVLKELSGGQEAVTETPGQNMQSLKQRVIEDQTFEIQLDDWGMVTFTSVAPEDNSNKPEFLLMKNDKIMYEFPEITAAISDSFGQVSGVKFSDVNMDGKKDILLLLQYSNDGDSWNMPVPPAGQRWLLSVQKISYYSPCFVTAFRFRPPKGDGTYPPVRPAER